MNLFKGREGHGRSFAKAVSWRITGSIDTFVISFFVTGKISLADTIAAVEVMTKIVIYYLHERCVGGRTLGAPQRLTANHQIRRWRTAGFSVACSLGQLFDAADGGVVGGGAAGSMMTVLVDVEERPWLSVVTQSMAVDLRRPR
jgi:uncharacterized membrane protein